MKPDKPPFGKLYLIPTTLGDNEPLEVLPISIKGTVERINHFIVENQKSDRRFIKKISPRKSQSGLQLLTLNKYTGSESITSFLEPCLAGHSMAILSEAGCPSVADPGAAVVRLAHEKNIKVVPLVGPSSVVLALMASGLNGQEFTFNGYLPIDSVQRKKQIKFHEKNSRQNGYSQLFIETPYRNDSLVADLLKSLASSTQMCIACDLTLATEYIVTKTVEEWKSTKIPPLHKRPAIFIFQA
jgi:16S rRNA (cytidine1402-2'-O)-methyltransferase